MVNIVGCRPSARGSIPRSRAFAEARRDATNIVASEEHQNEGRTGVEPVILGLQPSALPFDQRPVLTTASVTGRAALICWSAVSVSSSSPGLAEAL